MAAGPRRRESRPDSAKGRRVPGKQIGALGDKVETLIGNESLL